MEILDKLYLCRVIQESFCHDYMVAVACLIASPDDEPDYHAP
jgi:hypothetical protein